MYRGMCSFAYRRVIGMQVLDRMHSAGIHSDLLSYNTEIAALCHCGRIDEALAIARETKAGIPGGIDAYRHTILIGGSAAVSRFQEARMLLDELKESGTMTGAALAFGTYTYHLARHGLHKQATQLLQVRLLCAA